MAERIESLVARSETQALVAMYFDTKGPFAGATFVTLTPNHAYRIDAADLVATALLDVRFRPHAVRGLLNDDADELSDMLMTIDPDIDLWDPQAPLDNAEVLWHRVRKYPWIDWVIAGKLLARKRPRLIPVVDRVVKRELQDPSGVYWRPMQAALSDANLQARIDRLGHGLGLPPEVTTLRLLDAATWMWGSESKNARRCRQELGLPVNPRQPR